MTVGFLKGGSWALKAAVTPVLIARYLAIVFFKEEKKKEKKKRKKKVDKTPELGLNK